MIAFNKPTPISEAEHPKFEPGTLIVHRRYGYRGVVVEADSYCCADEAWYQKNQTQPDRDQPWYHVLVDGSPVCTYAAAENLIRDPSGLPIDHPLVDEFFHAFADGAYVRNDRAWPA